MLLYNENKKIFYYSKILKQIAHFTPDSAGVI